MIRLFFVALFVLSAEPSAACHRFSRWHYPWPQRCPIAAQQGGPQQFFAQPKQAGREFVAPQRDNFQRDNLREEAGFLPKPNEERSWYVEITRLPEGLPPLTPVESAPADDETRARLLLRPALESRQ